MALRTSEVVAVKRRMATKMIPPTHDKFRYLIADNNGGQLMPELWGCELINLNKIIEFTKT